MKNSRHKVAKTVRAALLVAIAAECALPFIGQALAVAGNFVDATERLGIHFRQQASPTAKNTYWRRWVLESPCLTSTTTAVSTSS